MKRNYKKPEAIIINVNISLMSTSLENSYNTIYNGCTQVDSKGPGTGGTQEVPGDGDLDLDGAKRWSWSEPFDE